MQTRLTITLCVFCLPIITIAAERDVQLGMIDFQRDFIELRNFGSEPEDLTGWRFCSHNNVEGEFRYTGSSGLNGITLEADSSLFVWLNDDGPGGNGHVNVSDLGGRFATTLDQGPYSVNLYWPNGGSLSFGASDDMVDHMQWDIGGTGSNQADARNLVAFNAGLWGNTSDWISTASTTVGLKLKEASEGSLLHGSVDYLVLIAGDVNQDGTIDAADAGAMFANWGNAGSGDVNVDGIVDAADAGIMFSNWTGDRVTAVVPEPEAALFVWQVCVAVAGCLALFRTVRPHPARVAARNVDRLGNPSTVRIRRRAG